MIKLLLSMSVFFCLTIHAYEQNPADYSVLEDAPPNVNLFQLASLSSDQDTDLYYLNLMLDKGSSQISGFYNAPDQRNSPSNRDGRAFALADIESANGAVLLVRSNRNVLLLKGLLDRPSQSGKFTIKYLADGILNRYESCDFELTKEAPGKWFIKNSYNGEKVNSIRVITWTAGIRTIQGICPR